jgi:hypothetical protein
MEALGCHVTFDLQGRLPIARDPAEWDRATRTLARVAAPWNDLGFCLVSDHTHLLLAVARALAGRAAQAVECALGWFRRPDGTPQRETWNPPRFTEVRDRRHLDTSAAYVLQNGAIATGTDPLLWRWSSAWDVLGLRIPQGRLATGFETGTQDFVARVLVGDARWRPQLARRLEVATDPPQLLGRLAAVALGWSPGATDLPYEVRAQWRRLVAGVGEHRGWSRTQLGSVLGLSPGGVRKIGAPRPDELAAALRLLGLIDAGVPADQLLRDQPPDPLPAGSRVRAVVRTQGDLVRRRSGAQAG